jgi:hypothetical protein
VLGVGGLSPPPVSSFPAVRDGLARGLVEFLSALRCTLWTSPRIGVTMRIKLEIDCPECGSEVLATLDDVARQRIVRCVRGHSIELVDDGGGAGKVNRSLNDLERTLQTFGR